MNYNNTLICHINDFNCANKRVLLRIDANIPLANGVIISDFRLVSMLPTLKLLLQKQAHIILVTHIDRPHGYDERFSVKPIRQWLQERGYKVEVAATIDNLVNRKNKKTSDKIFLLENIRFFTGEQDGDLKFAQNLAACTDFYVNDAWADMHRDDASIALVPQFFDKTKKSIGLLVEKELQELAQFSKSAKVPRTILLGGGKSEDKFIYLENMVKHKSAEIILLCPLMSNFFLPKKIAAELNISREMITRAKHVMNSSQKNDMQLILPTDYLVTTNNFKTLENFEADKIPQNAYIISIGDATVEKYCELIKNSKKVLFNGMTGFFDKPKTLEPMHKLLSAIAQSCSYSVIAGGDSVAAVRFFNLQNNISYCSTGGGATLAFISGTRMPGLDPLM